jgi:hypothetical protein
MGEEISEFGGKAMIEMSSPQCNNYPRVDKTL